MEKLILSGTIEGLLQRGAPLVGPYGQGAVFLADTDCDEAFVNLATDDGTEAMALSELSLDMSSHLGRFIALDWLLDKGHDLRAYADSEHVVQILSWSVLNVAAGGAPLQEVKKSWVGASKKIASTLPRGAKIGASKRTSSSTIYDVDLEPDFSVVDAVELSNGYALIHPDGTLTLPRLIGDERSDGE